MITPRLVSLRAATMRFALSCPSGVWRDNGHRAGRRGHRTALAKSHRCGGVPRIEPVSATSNRSQWKRNRSLHDPAPKFRILKIYRAETGAEIRGLWCEASDIPRQRPGPTANSREFLSQSQWYAVSIGGG
jgi:hypothetical protein